MKKVLFGLLSLALISTTACKKSKDVPALTKENVAGEWVLDKVTFKYGSAEQDVTSQVVDDCQKDDIITLKVDLTYDSKDAGVPCTGDYTGTWALPAANKFQLDADTYDVVQWTGNSLATSESFTMGANSGALITYMKRK